jgi:hypothetical protein
MRKTTKSPGEKIVKDIKRATRKHYSSEEKIRIVPDGLSVEDRQTTNCSLGQCPNLGGSSVLSDIINSKRSVQFIRR